MISKRQTKCSGRPFAVCLEKRSRAAFFIEDSNGVTLKDQDAILNRWRDYFSDLLNPVNATPIQIHEEQVGEDIQITEADVNAVIKSLKTGKAPGEDDIRPEMLKAMNIYGVRWLTRVCKVACSTGQAPKQWQTSVIIPIHKKGDKRKCTNYRGISLISVPGKVYAKCIEKKCREVVEPLLTDAQCCFRPGRSTMDQIFALQQIFEKSWEYAKEVNACFVDLKKAYDRIPRDKLWAVLLQYGIDGQLLTAIKSLYVHSEVCVRVNSATTKPFRVSVGLRQGCSLSPILFLIYMDGIVKKSESCGGVKIGECTVQHLLFADDLVLLDSTQNGLQQALDKFSDACSVAGMKISSTKTETMCLSRQPKKCSLQINGVPRAVAAAPQTPQLGGPTLPKGAPNCLEGPEVASIQKQSFAWRIALNGIFCAQILYISVLKIFAIAYFQIAS